MKCNNPILAAAAVALAAAGCTTDGGGGAGGAGAETITIGQKIDRSVCTLDEQCPIGYACVASFCELQFPDRDADDYNEGVDCNDQNGGIHPGATEVCNGVDDNCNGAIDEGVSNSCGLCGPDPIEACDLVDNDCDGLVDEECIGGTLAEVEPNDGASFCQEIPLPVVVNDTVTITGTFDPAGDIDSYCLHAIAGQSAIFEIDSALLGSPTDAKIALYDRANGSLLVAAENGFAQGKGYDPYMEFDFVVDRDGRLDVTNLGGTGGMDHIYELKITATSPPGACDDADGDLVSPCDGDCDDSDPLVFPAQQEICDEIDNNCDGLIDDGCPLDALREKDPNGTIGECMLVAIPTEVFGTISPQLDQDTYCFFVPRNTTVAIDIDAQEPPLISQLDSKLTVLEISGTQIAANDDGTDPQTGYSEPLSDSFIEQAFWLPGTYAVRVQSADPSAGSIQHSYVLRLNFASSVDCAADADGDGVTPCEGDCNDNDPNVYFGAVEVCDGRDNNCDNVGDDAGCTGDWDGDGFTGLSGDCDETNPTINPTGTEICDGFDNDCNGLVDDGVLNACGTCGYPPPEICGDNIDNDCDGVIDTGCDVDGDGDGVTPDQGDCNDGRNDVYPGAVEVCDDADNNCDGSVDEFAKNQCGTCSPPRGTLVELCDGIDNNCNGLVDDGALNACGYCGPAPPEICDGLDNNCNAEIDEGLINACGTCGPLPIEACDGVDNDCNGQIDEGCDTDGDGDGVSPRDGDCDDNAITIYWGAPELCNGIDDDCNGWVDDDYVACAMTSETESNNTPATCDTVTWPLHLSGTIADLADRDHYCFTVPADTTLGFDIDATDIGSALDSDLQLYDDQQGVLDSNDNGTAPDDTMGTTSDSYISYWFENAGTYTLRVGASGTSGPAMFYELIIKPETGCQDLDRDGATSCTTDCDDFNASINPGAIDICDTVDNNCDGFVDERCFQGCLDDLFEQNDSAGTGVPLTPGLTGGLTMCGGDADYFTYTGVAGERLLVDVNVNVDPAAVACTYPDSGPCPAGQVCVDFATADKCVMATIATLYDTDFFTPLVASPSDQSWICYDLPADGTYAVGLVSPIGSSAGYEITVMNPTNPCPAHN